jgi:hypothetical protein
MVPISRDESNDIEQTLAWLITPLKRLKAHPEKFLRSPTTQGQKFASEVAERVALRVKEIGERQLVLELFRLIPQEPWEAIQPLVDSDYEQKSPLLETSLLSLKQLIR